MRALIVLGGDPPGAALLRRCARQADWTAAADSGLAAFHSAGLVPDFLLGDMDSVDPGVLRRQAEFRTQGRDHPILPSSPETQYLKCGIYQVFPV